MNSFIDRTAWNRRPTNRSVEPGGDPGWRPSSFVDNVTVFLARLFMSAVNFLRSEFSCHTLRSRIAMVGGRIGYGINRLSSAKAEIGFDSRIGELCASC